MKRNNKGFTLLELLGVVLIIGFLLLVVVASVTNVMNSSRQKLVDVQLKALENAAETYVASKPNLIPKLRSETTTIFLYNLKHAGLVEKEVRHPVTEELLPDDMIIEIHRDGNFFEYRAIEDTGTYGNVAEDDDLVIVVMGALNDTVQQNYFTHNWANEEAIKAFTVDGTQIDNSHINVTITVDSTVISELETNILREYLVEYKIEYMGYKRVIVRKVNLVDTMPPLLEFSNDPILSGECTTYNWQTQGVTASDNSGSVTVSYVGTVECIPGIYTLTYTAEDINGNSTTKDREVEIVETLIASDPSEPEEPTGPLCDGTFIDERDGNEYGMVTIGAQCWMTNNLAYLPSVTSGTATSNNDPRYYVYGYVGTDVTAAKATLNYQKYGVIYNWHGATGGLDGESVQGACPDGWYIPTDQDWKNLEIELGMDPEVADTTMWRGSKEGQQLKSIDPSWGGTNIYGFSAVPGGRLASGSWNYVDVAGYYWASTLTASNQSLFRYLHSTYTQILREQITLDTGYSVRCIKHEFTPGPSATFPTPVVGESCYQEFATDSRDGNTYNTVQLGSQCWFAENLAYLPAVHTNQGFNNAGNQENPAYGVYGYSGTSVATAKADPNYEKYGSIYNGYALDIENVCPTGWRVPSDNDWKTFETFLNLPASELDLTMERGTDQGKKLKTVPPVYDGTDEYGFRGLPAGARESDGTYGVEDFNAMWWTDTAPTATSRWIRALVIGYDGIFRTEPPKSRGYYVRCIYDE